MIKRIVGNDQSQKNGEIGEILGRPHKKRKEKKELLLGRELKKVG
jgi:hypothetical protein